jgi:hypothetical protein
VLLLLNLLVMRSPKGGLPSPQRIGDLCAIIVAATLLASSLQLAAAVPAPTDPPYEEGVFELKFDPVARVWKVDTDE